MELTTPEGITGLGSAYTGTKQLRDALDLFQQDPVTLHKVGAEMTNPMSAIDIALWDIRGKEENLPVMPSTQGCALYWTRDSGPLS